MKKFISTILLATMILPQVSYAQQPAQPKEKPVDVKEIPLPTLLPGEKDPGEAISPMKRLQRAAFTGVLLSPAAVAKVIVELSTIDDRISIEVEKVKSEEIAVCERRVSDTEAKLESQKKIIEAELNEKVRSYNSLDSTYKSLKDEHESEWDPSVWLGIGAAGGIALSLLTTFAVTQATK